MWHFYTMGYYSTIKGVKLLAHTPTRMSLENIKPSEKKPDMEDCILCDYVYMRSPEAAEL